MRTNKKKRVQSSRTLKIEGIHTSTGGKGAVDVRRYEVVVVVIGLLVVVDVVVVVLWLLLVVGPARPEVKNKHGTSVYKNHTPPGDVKRARKEKTVRTLMLVVQEKECWCVVSRLFALLCQLVTPTRKTCAPVKNVSVRYLFGKQPGTREMSSTAIA
jgi:hypothetical protein